MLKAIHGMPRITMVLCCNCLENGRIEMRPEMSGIPERSDELCSCKQI